MSWFSILKSQPHHEGRTYNDPNKLGRELSAKEVEENGEIFLLDAIKNMPHVEKRGNTVLLDPKWLDGMQPDNGLYGYNWSLGDKIFGFSFDFRDIHKKKLCIDVYYQRKSRRREFDDMITRSLTTKRVGDYLKAPMCIAHRQVPAGVEGDEDFSQADYKRTATPADDYAAIIYMTSDKEYFNSLWNTRPIVEDTKSSQQLEELENIINNYIYERLSDGRLKQRAYDDLTDKEKDELIDKLLETSRVGSDRAALSNMVRRRMNFRNPETRGVIL